MDTGKGLFNIIRFSPDMRQYYPGNMPREEWMTNRHVRHDEVAIPLGASRYGGPVIDFPPGLDFPSDMRFAAQLDLAEFSPYDKSGLLPKSGQLLFFADIVKDRGKVIYKDLPNEELVRTIAEHEDNFFMGVLIDKIWPDTEVWDENYIEKFKAGSEFTGAEKSKVFGIFTHCQCDIEEIGSVAFSDKIVLLQVGENGFNDEGVFSVLISENDLAKKVFDNCEFFWAQS